jgi:hypothetical protein
VHLNIFKPSQTLWRLFCGLEEIDRPEAEWHFGGQGWKIAKAGSVVVEEDAK